MDNGCGDALPVLPHPLKFEQVYYTGYDLSGPALQLAAENLASLPGTVVLKEGNMLSLIAEEENMFDVIVGSNVFTT